MMELQREYKPECVSQGPHQRTKLRFQIEQEVRYKILFGQHIAETGIGRTANISSRGVWFTTEHPLATGTPVELSIDWPVLLNDSCAIQLMIYGCIVRSNEKGAAVMTERYEFRTSSRAFRIQNRARIERPTTESTTSARTTLPLCPGVKKEEQPK
jgi:hypothetical protein